MVPCMSLGKVQLLTQPGTDQAYDHERVQPKAYLFLHSGLKSMFSPVADHMPLESPQIWGEGNSFLPLFPTNKWPFCGKLPLKMKVTFSHNSLASLTSSSQTRLPILEGSSHPNFWQPFP